MTAPAPLPPPPSAFGSADRTFLFLTRGLRMFGYGFLAVVLVLYLKAVGLDDRQVGFLLALTLAGDTLISLFMTVSADRIGRRAMLIIGAVLVFGAGLVFAGTNNFWLLLVAATIGVISPSGYEVGPFLSIEQAALSQVVPGQRRTHVFAWYNLTGSVATALGSLAGGWLAGGLQNVGWSDAGSYRVVLLAYAGIGFALAILFTLLSPATEAPPCLSVPSAGNHPAAQPPSPKRLLGLTKSKGVVFKLSGLFAIDAFGGGFVVQSVVAYWFVLRFHANAETLGSIFFGANLLAALSSLSAAWLAARIGLIRTMVFTHVPSNLLLLAVPLMPNLPLAIALLLLRFSISQMDVPTRQSYTVAVVDPEERSAAAGITGIARTTGAAFAQLFVGYLMAGAALLSSVFYIGEALKLLYDLLLYRSFVKLRPPEERPSP